MGCPRRAHLPLRLPFRLRSQEGLLEGPGDQVAEIGHSVPIRSDLPKVRLGRSFGL